MVSRASSSGICVGRRACVRAISQCQTGEAAAALSSFDFEVFGKVQGVFFRKHTKRFADANGLRGWCKNTPSGTVVGQAEGNASAIVDFKRWLLRTGSPKSRIQRAEFRAERDNAAEAQFDSFKIIR